MKEEEKEMNGKKEERERKIHGKKKDEKRKKIELEKRKSVMIKCNRREGRMLR